MKKEQLKPFFQKHPWALKPLAVYFLIVSPIAIPAWIIFSHKDDVVSWYRQCFDMLFEKVE